MSQLLWVGTYLLDWDGLPTVFHLVGNLAVQHKFRAAQSEALRWIAGRALQEAAGARWRVQSDNSHLHSQTAAKPSPAGITSPLNAITLN